MNPVVELVLVWFVGSLLIGARYGWVMGRHAATWLTGAHEGAGFGEVLDTLKFKLRLLDESRHVGPFGDRLPVVPPTATHYVTEDYEIREVVDAASRYARYDRCHLCADVTGFGSPARTGVVCTGKCREVAVVGHPMPVLSWQYHARPVRAVDGDTVVLQFDLGFRVLAELRVRLYGVNAPEKHGGTLEDGEAAMAFTEAWLEEAVAKSKRAWPLVVFTAHHPLQHSVDEVMETSFDRFIARIWRFSDERCLNDDLVESGNAVVFMDTGQ